MQRKQIEITGLLFLLCLFPLHVLSFTFHVFRDDSVMPEDSIMYFTLFRKNDEDPDSLLYFMQEDHESDEDLYALWDTIHAHPYEFEKLFITDSVIIKLTSETDDFFLPFDGNITSHYGWRRRRPHWGTDIDLEKGDTVRAAFSGIVRLARYYKGYGNCVIIRHFNGLETVYAHLSEINVHTNDEVKAGEVIGLGGNTGRSRGAHLHWEIRFLGKAIDAEDVVDFSNKKLKTNELILRKSDFYEKYDLRALRYRYRKDLGIHGHISKNASGVRYHKIRKGDTLGKLAKKYHTTVQELCKKNKIKPNTVLREGRLLKI